MNDYRTSHLHPAHANQYAHSFSDLTTYRGMVWRLERELLTKIVLDFPQRVRFDHLDFACGTGRILSHLRPFSTHRTGVDVSPSMLEYARASNPDADILEVDLTKQNILDGRKFDLITVFRFFPNAEPELRHDAMQVLAGLLSPDGYLIFNNHRNPGGIHNRLRHMAGRNGYRGMSMMEALDLIDEVGLEIAALHHLCMLLEREEHSPFSASLLFPLEWAMSRISFFSNLAQEHVFVCRKR